MLSKKEKAVMKSVFNEAAKNDGKCIVRPVELLQGIPLKMEFREDELAPILKVLELDDYYELIESDKNGEGVYCITLHQKGKAFIREIMSEQRAIKFKIVLTILGVIGGFLLTRLLNLIIS